jgi:hypothetical protein
MFECPPPFYALLWLPFAFASPVSDVETVNMHELRGVNAPPCTPVEELRHHVVVKKRRKLLKGYHYCCVCEKNTTARVIGSSSYCPNCKHVRCIVCLQGKIEEVSFDISILCHLRSTVVITFLNMNFLLIGDSNFLPERGVPGRLEQSFKVTNISVECVSLITYKLS